MKRLLEDLSALDASEQKLAELFEVTAPYKADPFRKRRVLVKLGENAGRAPRILRGALVAGVLLVTATAAALGGGFLDGWWSEPVVERPQPTVVQALGPAPVAAAPQPTVAEAAAVEQPAKAQPEPVSEAPRPSAKLDERAKSKNGEDPTQVLDAMKALRAEGDAAKAQGLLNDYMKSHPNGLLSEDALALSIEAAAARRDPRAKDYAKRYLAKFPNGKYRALATRALSQ